MFPFVQSYVIVLYNEKTFLCTTEHNKFCGLSCVPKRHPCWKTLHRPAPKHNMLVLVYGAGLWWFFQQGLLFFKCIFWSVEYHKLHSIKFHYICDKITADISTNQQLQLKQSRWINSTTGKRKHMLMKAVRKRKRLTASLKLIHRPNSTLEVEISKY